MRNLGNNSRAKRIRYFQIAVDGTVPCGTVTDAGPRSFESAGFPSGETLRRVTAGILTNTTLKLAKQGPNTAGLETITMQKGTSLCSVIVAIIAGIIGACGAVSHEKALHASNLIIVIDGLRPDYITPEAMPNLHALGEKGIFAEAHSAAFPSSTRVNSASIISGTYPARHGIMHNQTFVPGVSDKGFSTARAENLEELAEYSGGQLLSTPSLGQVLVKSGKRLFFTGTTGAGYSLLQNPVAGARADVEIWTASGFFVPADAQNDAIEAVGPLAHTRASRTAWAFDAYLYQVTGDDPPDAVIMWLNDADSAGHRYGVGAKQTMRAVGRIDDQIGRLLDVLDQNGLRERVNILVTSDHGISTNAGEFSVDRILRDNGFAANDLKVVSNMVFLRREDRDLLVRVVEALQRDSETGNIYTRPVRPGSSEGIVVGTLSTAVIRWDHERAADVLVSPAWNAEANQHGFVGSTTRGGNRPAGHGSDSPYDLHIPLVAAGPDIKRGIRSRVPTGNVDLAPTVLHLLGIAPPPEMSGRVLHELLREGGPPDEVAVTKRTHRAAVTLAGGVRYEAELDTVEVGSTVYFRGARTMRSVLPPP